MFFKAYENILTPVFFHENIVYKSYFSNHQSLINHKGRSPGEETALLLDKDEGGKAKLSSKK